MQRRKQGKQKEGKEEIMDEDKKAGRKKQERP